MYSKRIKIFVILIGLVLAAYLLRLGYLQLIDNCSQEVDQLTLRYRNYKKLATVRGNIYDRKGKVLATDKPQFQICVDYKLTSFADERISKGRLLLASEKSSERYEKEAKKIQAGLEELNYAVEKCVYFGLPRYQVEERLKEINEQVWNLRLVQAWRKHCSDSEMFSKHQGNIAGLKLSDVIADFQKCKSDPNERLKLIMAIDITEMHEDWSLVKLQNNDDVFTAQIEFADCCGINVEAGGYREYPYGSVASQTIGWVGPVTGKRDKELFSDDRFLNYLTGDVGGREDGAEYVCEAALRGRRGEVFEDVNGEPARIEKQFGQDIHLTLDIELQKRIEECIVDCNVSTNCKKPTSVVVINVENGDILVMASLPRFDLNKIRQTYNDIKSDANEPLRNRAINKHYPPGSVVKPLILIAGLESGKITSEEVIHCTSQVPPTGWPRCWIQKTLEGVGHDDWWQNYARNAIKGSCNIYFSHLADRLDSRVLQKWLYDFGYGRTILSPPSDISEQYTRNFRQTQGQISDAIGKSQQSGDFNEVPVFTNTSEKRWFGIGQGNLRASPLQVANSMAIIARRGVYKQPRLFMNQQSETETLKMFPATFDIIWDGMKAVVNEYHGTANNQFVDAGFDRYGVIAYGKTGSTEKPENAWFAGFAEDKNHRSISFSVLVEGGKAGAADAAPIARKVIQFCIDAGHIGHPNDSQY